MKGLIVAVAALLMAPLGMAAAQQAAPALTQMPQGASPISKISARIAPS
jgi:hypothetical protein